MSISVLLPCYNGTKTLARAVDSVLNQTASAHIDELIIILNKCTDDSELIAKSYKDERVKVIHQDIFTGIVPSLNAGILASSNECQWIARQDSDDFWYPEKIAKQIKFLEANQDIKILGGQLQYVRKDTFEKIEYARTNYPTTNDKIKESILMGTNALGHPSVLFSKEILLKVGMYQDLFPLCEDMDLWLRASKYFKLANLDEVLVDYTESNNPEYNPLSPKLCAHNMKQVLQYFGDK